MHQKHPPIPRPALGRYARTEFALVGTTCERMEALMRDWTEELSGAYRCVTVTGKHEASDTPVRLRVTEKVFESDRDGWNEYDDKLLARDYDLALVNGNHYPAARQIVFVDEKKAGTLERRRDQLTDIFAIVHLEGKPALPDWLREKCHGQFRPPIMTTLSMLERVIAGIEHELDAAVPALRALILAGGQSSRMGEDKSRLVYSEGQIEVERLARLCQSCAVPAYVSVREAGDSPTPERPEVVDRFVGLGPAGAIASAFLAHPDVAWLVLACDLPLMDEATLLKLIEARRTDRYATAVRGPGQSWPEPLVAIYEPRAYPRLLQFLGLGYSCPRKLLINSDTEVLDLEDARPITNANTPGEREEARLTAAFSALDAANAADPRHVTFEGKEVPYELLYARRMTGELDRFAPEAPEPVKLAARAQHLERWRSPREDYPMDREGYLRWRTDLKQFHANRAWEILSGSGYSEEVLERVAFLLQKKRLKRDDDTQTLEDVICIVFLRYYAADFAAAHPQEKVVDILRKTWGKMSHRGRAAALDAELPAAVRELVLEATAPPETL